MPEAAVDKNGDTLTRESYVSSDSSRSHEDFVVLAKAQPHLVEFGPKATFGERVPLAIPSHRSRDGDGACFWRPEYSVRPRPTCCRPNSVAHRGSNRRTRPPDGLSWLSGSFEFRHVE
jgi:hypothetical protein